MERFENLRVQSGRFSPFGGMEDVVRRFGVHRLLFGSGAPRYSPGAAVAMVMLAELDEASKARIAGGNLLELMERIRYDA
jgi:predicted TIM-barrel fold metal-dependent hydrolase